MTPIDICEIGNGKYIEAGEVYIEPGNRCNKMKCSEVAAVYLTQIHVFDYREVF